MWESASSRPILDDARSSAPMLGPAQPEDAIAEFAPRSHDAFKDPETTGAERIGWWGSTASATPAALATRALLTVAVFVVPVVVDPRTVDAFNLVKATALWVLLVAAAAAWCVSAYFARGRASFSRSPIVYLSLVLFGIATLAALLSPNPTLSVIGLYHRYEGLASLAMYVVALLLIVVAFRGRPDSLRKLIAATGAAAAFVAAYVIVQKVGLDPVEWRGTTGTTPAIPIGSLGNPAFTASFLGIAAPFVAYLSSSAQTRSAKVTWRIAGAGVIAALVLTQGRAGIIAAAAGVSALALFASKFHVRKKVASVAVLLTVLTALPWVAPGFIDPPAAEARPAVAEFRTETWTAAVQMTSDRPLLGWGPESFYGQYPRYRSASEAREQGLTIADKPHNIFLGWATSTGVIGLVAFLALIATALLLVSVRRERSKVMMQAAFGGGLIAYLAQGVYSVDIPPLAFMGWFTLAGIAALTGTERSSPPAPVEKFESTRQLRMSQVATIAAVVAAAALIVAGTGPWRADGAAWDAERRSGLGWSADTWRRYQAAIDRHPLEPAYYGLAASFLERVVRGDPDIENADLTNEGALLQAAQLFESASSKQPRNVHFMIGAARVYSALGETANERFFADADEWLRRASARDPRDPVVYELRADLLRRWAGARGDPADEGLMRRSRAQDQTAEALRTGRVRL